MSYDTKGPDAQGVVALILAAAAIMAFGLWKFSAFLGADMGVVSDAVFQSMAIAGVIGVVAYLIRPSLWLLLIGALMILWPTWWDVLHSIAMGGGDPAVDWRSPGYPPQFYEHGVFRWGIELMLAAGFFATLIFGERHGYY